MKSLREQAPRPAGYFRSMNFKAFPVVNRPVTKLIVAAAWLCLFLGGTPLGAQNPSSPSAPAQFRKVVLDQDQEIDGKKTDTLKDPMEISLARDGRLFFIERDGAVKVWKPQTKQSTIVGKLNVFSGLEDGLLGLTLDPNFLSNGWIYLYYSVPETARDQNGQKAGENRVARFTLTGDELDLGSEKVLIRVATQREECCHSGGSLTFDAKGNLYLSAGDNTNPFGSDGYAPIDERPGRSPWDAQKSSANRNDLRGKILRVTPKPDGTVSIPPGNLFPADGSNGRPEIYVMGCRNPFRISVDPATGWLFWGEVGPDAGTGNPMRGPAGFDEINLAKAAGNYGWPYFIADNRRYLRYDFATQTSGPPFDPLHPENHSPNNTGASDLPPAQPALIYYSHSPSTRWPVLNAGGGRTAMAGPVYHFDPALKSEHKLPARYDKSLFIYEWSRNWVREVKLDSEGKVTKINPFLEEMTFKRPMDLELGPDGCLYMIEWGTAWANNLDTQIIRIEYVGNEH